jgi:5-methylcytosine-specific restriction endonuclease McrA
MPNSPENQRKYPDNWPEIRASILARAKNCCEWCGVANYSKHPDTGAHVVLTIMHLDHDTGNNSVANLKAACQRCHNSYDAPKRASNLKIRRQQKIERTQRRLFE